MYRTPGELSRHGIIDTRRGGREASETAHLIGSVGNVKRFVGFTPAPDGRTWRTALAQDGWRGRARLERVADVEQHGRLRVGQVVGLLEHRSIALVEARV